MSKSILGGAVGALLGFLAGRCLAVLWLGYSFPGGGLTERTRDLITAVCLGCGAVSGTIVGATGQIIKAIEGTTKPPERQA